MLATAHKVAARDAANAFDAIMRLHALWLRARHGIEDDC
jgi:hypothetical protein